MWYSVQTPPFTTFQSQTGFPGHFDLAILRKDRFMALLFQSQTGFPGHFDKLVIFDCDGTLTGFNPRRASQAILTQ